MKRIIGAAVAGILAFSGVYALAASLAVSSNTLGAGRRWFRLARPTPSQ
jgi:hypothetical protein